MCRFYIKIKIIGCCGTRLSCYMFTNYRKASINEKPFPIRCAEKIHRFIFIIYLAETYISLYYNIKMHHITYTFFQFLVLSLLPKIYLGILFINAINVCYHQRLIYANISLNIREMKWIKKVASFCFQLNDAKHYQWNQNWTCTNSQPYILFPLLLWRDNERVWECGCGDKHTMDLK